MAVTVGVRRVFVLHHMEIGDHVTTGIRGTRVVGDAEGWSAIDETAPSANG